MTAQSCGAIQMPVTDSTIKQLLLCIGCIGRVKFEAIFVAGYFNGTILYHKLYEKKQDDAMLYEGERYVSVTDFQTYSMHISGGINEYSRNQHNDLLVLATIDHYRTSTSLFRRRRTLLWGRYGVQTVDLQTCHLSKTLSMKIYLTWSEVLCWRKLWEIEIRLKRFLWPIATVTYLKRCPFWQKLVW